MGRVQAAARSCVPATDRVRGEHPLKHLALISLLLLCASSVLVYRSYPGKDRDAAVIYWSTDANPQRRQQVTGFHDWLKQNGHVRDDGSPVVRVEIDTANRSSEKQIIQSVSGVGDDIMDVSGDQLPFFAAIGLFKDVSSEAAELGFDPSRTYPSIVPEITVDGRQYLFPCNVFAQMYWVNQDTFDRYDQPLPPERWTFEQFEQQGRAFVAAANAGRDQREVFFVNTLNLNVMRRSLGLGVFNETGTRCMLDDERFIRCLRLLHQWTYEDHLLPSASEAASFDTATGYGGSSLQLFHRGQYAMIAMGRYALIQLRKFGDMRLSVVEPPHGGFPNTLIGTRGAGVYAAGKHRAEAMLFLSYLASGDYNMQIVRDADGLPPNPLYARSEAFLRPPDHRDEWSYHEPFQRAVTNIGIATEQSPFILVSDYTRVIGAARDAVMSGRLEPRQAARQAARRINETIDRNINDDDRLKERYVLLCGRQQQIDSHRAADKPVPLDWISDTFHRHHYVAKGWAQ